MYISRIKIKNFRNFKEFDISLGEKTVIVGENTAGKTNLIHALRLLLDPSLPDSARQLSENDFWDGLEDPMGNGDEITIQIELQGFENKESLLAILQDYLVDNGELPTARITYKFFPSPQANKQDKLRYVFLVYGGDDETNVFGYQQRKWMPLHVLPALRDAESDLQIWSKSPLRPLLEALTVAPGELEDAASEIDSATEKILDLAEVKTLSKAIEDRLESMVGKFHAVDPSLGIVSTDALRLLRSLRLFVDGLAQRKIGETSLGICNVLYLTLLVLELERKEAEGERAATILVIEEPEAHLHPHLQRLVYRDFLQRDSGVILTTHSPNIVSVAPVKSLAFLKNHGDANGTLGSSTISTELTDYEVQDIERYLDTTRGEILFSRGVILVEGDAERLLIPSFANLLDINLDECGISVCSVQGTDFAPYVKLLCEKSLNIPFVVITDGDPVEKGGEIKYYAGHKRCMKLAKIFKPTVHEELENLFEEEDWKKLDDKLDEIGLCICDKTLEIELVGIEYEDELLSTLKELGAGTTKQERFKEVLGKIAASKANKKIEKYFIARIEDYGKGRFAMRFSHKLTADRVPHYIRLAINYIADSVTCR